MAWPLRRIRRMFQVHICSDLDTAFDHYWQVSPPILQTTVRQTAREQQHLQVTSATGPWLEQQLARKQGISANQTVKFLAGYLWNLIEQIDPRLPDQSPFEPSISVWAIEQYLQQPSTFEALAAAQKETSPVTRFRLASQIASLFNQYLVFRLDWLDAWQHDQLKDLGAHEGWQSHLWRYLLKHLPNIQAAHPFELFNRQDPSLLNLREQLPKHLIVWSMDRVPALYWQSLQWLSQITHVTVYLFDVSPAFTDALVSKKQWLKAQLDDPAQQAYLEMGHPLLSQWGRAQAEQQRYLLDRDLDFDHHQFSHRQETTHLAWVQNTFLDGIAPDPAQMAQRALIPSDDSIRIVSGHGPRRQLEALHQDIQHWLRNAPADEPRAPHNILVICPQLDVFRPFIAGVFDDISFRVTQPLPRTNGFIVALLGWCELLTQDKGVISTQQLLVWLALPHAQRFTSTEDHQVVAWQAWLNNAGIRTLDQAHVGMQRLLLGLAIEPVASADYLNRQPVQSAGEPELPSLALLASIFDAFARGQRTSATEKTVDQWQTWIQHQWPSTLSGGGDDRALALEAAQGQLDLTAALNQMTQAIARSGAKPCMTLAVFLEALRQQLDKTSGSNMRASALTFAAPEDIRHRAFKLIAWVGLDDGAYPRPRNQSALDLMASHPRWGDQQSHVTDRAVFLESLMLTQALWLYYTGRDLRRNDKLNPSVLIADLQRFLPWLGMQQLPLNAIVQPWQQEQRLADWPLQSTEKLIQPTQVQSLGAQDLRRIKRMVEDPSKHFARHALGLFLEWHQEPIDPYIPWALTKKTNAGIYIELNHGREQALVDHPALAPTVLAQHQQAMTKREFARIKLVRDALMKSAKTDCLVSDEENPKPRHIMMAWVEQVFDCAFNDDPKPKVIFSWRDGKEIKTLKPINQDLAQQTWQWLLDHEVTARYQPSQLFSDAALAWAEGKKPDQIQLALGTTVEDDERNYSDLTKRYAAIIWRGSDIPIDSLIQFFETHLASLKQMISK